MSFDVSRYAIVACPLLRCTALSLADGTPRPPDDFAQLVRARKILVEWLASQAGEDPGGERKRFGRLMEQVAWDGRPLEAVVVPALAAPVAALLSLPDYDLEWADFVVAEFTRQGLHLNEAETHALSTLMTFFDD